MPWHVAKTKKCPETKPWGVINNETGETDGRCHKTRAGAIAQLSKLYVKYKQGKIK